MQASMKDGYHRKLSRANPSHLTHLKLAMESFILDGIHQSVLSAVSLILSDEVSWLLACWKCPTCRGACKLIPGNHDLATQDTTFNKITRNLSHVTVSWGFVVVTCDATLLIRACRALLLSLHRATLRHAGWAIGTPSWHEPIWKH